jgi:DNA-binding CsgD family transcriptional regulator
MQGMLLFQFRILVLILFLKFPAMVFGQNLSLQPSEDQMIDYVNILLERPNFEPKKYRDFLNVFTNIDSASYYYIVDRLEQLGPANDLVYKIRLLFLKADGVSKTQSKSLKNVEAFIQEMGELAESSGDNYLIAEAKWFTGLTNNTFSNYVNSMVNCLEAIEMLEQILPKEKLYNHYYFLSQLSFLIQDYESSILYAQLALDHDQEIDSDSKLYQTRFINAIGQSYIRLDMLDEAEQYLTLSKNQSVEYKSDIWVGINDCFIGQVQLLKKNTKGAKASLSAAIQNSEDIDKNIAAHAKSWLGRAYWLEGKYDSALFFLSAAEEWLEKPKFQTRTQANYFLTDLYLFMSDLYKIRGDKVKGDVYFTKFKNLNDSLKTTSVLSSKTVAMLRLENERSRLALKLVEADKQNILLRDKIMMAISLFIFVLLLGWVQMRNNRLKLQKKIAIAETEKLTADKDFTMSQLNLLKNKLMEKTALVDQFEEKVKEMNLNVAFHEDLEKINKLKIVTEEGWKEFKDLFDRIYPGFMTRLRNKVPDITTAELRLATLIKLQYTAKEMAGVLGVSPDSIYKTRYRLRTRLNLSADHSLECFVETEI